jgi:hypothetical protein
MASHNRRRMKLRSHQQGPMVSVVFSHCRLVVNLSTLVSNLPKVPSRLLPKVSSRLLPMIALVRSKLCESRFSLYWLILCGLDFASAAVWGLTLRRPHIADGLGFAPPSRCRWTLTLRRSSSACVKWVASRARYTLVAGAFPFTS